jgi:uncharacterized protein
VRKTSSSKPARKKPTAISQRAKNKRQAQQRQKRLLLALGLLFCVGLAAGGYSLHRVYRHLEETQNLAFAEKLAAERAQVEYQAAVAAYEAAKRKAQAAEAQHKARKEQASAHQRPVLAGKPAVDESPAATQAPTPVVHDKPATNAGARARGTQPPRPIDKAAFSRYTPSADKKLIALVIDDIGYQKSEGEATIALPGKVTVAVIPFSPHSKLLAELAFRQGQEVMVHAPMQPKQLKRWGQGLHTGLGEADFKQQLNAMLDETPHHIGLNNHMGSLLTENRQAMNWLMEELPKRGLYFVDSRTSPNSQALAAARAQGIPSVGRDVFLDHNRQREAIRQQFERLVAAAERQGSAVGIGHPYPETLQVLREKMPLLAARGIELVTVSELLNAKRARLTASAADPLPEFKSP